MSLTFAITVAVSVILAVCLGQLLFSEFSLFSVGATLLLASALCSAIDFLQRSARSRVDAASDDIQTISRD